VCHAVCYLKFYILHLRN